MGILDNVLRTLRIRRGAPAIDPTPAATTLAEMPRPRSMTAHAVVAFSSAQDRLSQIKESRAMYRADTRVRKAVRATARDAVKGGPAVKVKNNPKAEQIATDLIKRLTLASHLDDWSRLTFRDGDTFLQIGVDGAGEVALVKRMPTLQMHRNTDERDMFTDPARAFWQSDEFYANGEPPDDAVWFAQWQIIHARWEHDEGSRYGEPMFSVGTKAYKRMTTGEDNMATRRWARAGMSRVHVLKGADETAIETYKERNREALEDPAAGVADFYTNTEGGVTAMQGDANLHQFDDVMHHVRTFSLASPIALGLLGYGQDLNRDVLDEQKEQYDRELEQITQWLEDEIVKPLLHLQWLLKGLLPESLDYDVTWKNKGTLTAADLKSATDAALNMRALGLGDDIVFATLARFIPGFEDLQPAMPQGEPNAADMAAGAAEENDDGGTA